MSEGFETTYSNICKIWSKNQIRSGIDSLKIDELRFCDKFGPRMVLDCDSEVDMSQTRFVKLWVLEFDNAVDLGWTGILEKFGPRFSLDFEIDLV